MRTLCLSIILLLSAVSCSAADSAADLKTASDAFAAGGFEKSNAVYNAISKTDPQNIKALSGAGRIALLSNKLQDAESLLRKALRLDPKNEQCRTDLAEALYRRDQFVEAASFLNEKDSTAMVRKLKSFADQTPYQLESSTGATSIPFANTDPLPAVEVKINGKNSVYF